MKYAALLLLAACSGSGTPPVLVSVPPPSASVMHVSWQLPSAYTDGSPLALSDIQSSTVHWGSLSGGPYAGNYVVEMPGVTADVQYSGASGNYFIVVTTKLISGKESAYSREVEYTVP